jgi:hypothetical protein
MTAALLTAILAAILMSSRFFRQALLSALLLLALVAIGFADPRRPTPVPQVSAGCPAGYNASPTTGTCVPSATTRCRAFPSPTGSCPTGWSYSPISRMCVESHC